MLRGQGLPPSMESVTMRAILFDLDGTLVNSSQGLVRGLNGWLAELGRPPLDQPAVEHMIGEGLAILRAAPLPQQRTG